MRGRGGGDAWTNYRGNSSEQHSTTAAAAGTIHWEQCKYCHFWYLQGVTINFDFAVFFRIEGQVLPLVDFVLLLPSRKWNVSNVYVHIQYMCTHINYWAHSFRCLVVAQQRFETGEVIGDEACPRLRNRVIIRWRAQYTPATALSHTEYCCSNT